MSGQTTDGSKLRLVLYAEDDEDDLFFFHRATSAFDGELDFRTVSNGAIAIEWLNGDGFFADRARFPLPDLLITDIKMPRRDGFEVLRFVRAHPQLKELPVIVYSTAMVEKDLAMANALHASNFIVKDSRCDAVVKYLRRYVDALAAPNLASLPVV